MFNQIANDQDFVKLTEGLDKGGLDNVEYGNEIEMQSSKLEEVKQTLVDTNSTKKQKLK